MKKQKLVIPNLAKLTTRVGEKQIKIMKKIIKLRVSNFIFQIKNNILF